MSETWKENRWNANALLTAQKPRIRILTPKTMNYPSQMQNRRNRANTKRERYINKMEREVEEFCKILKEVADNAREAYRSSQEINVMLIKQNNLLRQRIRELERKLHEKK